MSLDQPSRLANWPRITVRIVLILVVFFGLNWWVKKQQTTSPAAVEQTYVPPAAELRDGVAVMFLWDVRVKPSQATKKPSPSWREAGATSLYHQLQRLTKYAGQRSEIPLRTGVIIAGSSSSQTGEPDGIVEIVKMDAPTSGEQIEKSLAAVRSGIQSHYQEARRQALQTLMASGLRERHLIIISTDPPEEAGTYNQIMTNDVATHVHYITRRETASEMDDQFKTVLDQILTPVR